MESETRRSYVHLTSSFAVGRIYVVIFSFPMQMFSYKDVDYLK